MGLMDRNQQNSAAADAPGLEALAKAPNANEARYMRGDREPARSSVLTSNSKYLNSALFRDIFAQFGLRRNGGDVPATYLIPDMSRALSEVRDDTEFYALLMAEKKKNAELAEWLDRREPATFDAAVLRDHAEGTLGAEIHTFIALSGMEMQFMKTELQETNDLAYMMKTRANLHDVEHMVSGFGPNHFGEMALAMMSNAACYAYFTPELAKYITEAQLFITATGYYRTSLHYPAAMPGELDAIRQGIEAGQAVKKPLFLYRWTDYLDWQLDDIASDIGFTRGPGSEWAWSSDACQG